MKELLPVASIVVPVVTGFANLQACIGTLGISQFETVVDKALASLAHSLEETAVGGIALHHLYDAAGTCRVGASDNFEGVALREGDLAHRICDEALIVIERVFKRNPNGIAAETLQAICSNSCLVATVDDGCGLAFRETVVHLLL